MSCSGFCREYKSQKAEEASDPDRTRDQASAQPKSEHAQHAGADGAAADSSSQVHHAMLHCIPAALVLKPKPNTKSCGQCRQAECRVNVRISDATKACMTLRTACTCS